MKKYLEFVLTDKELKKYMGIFDYYKFVKTRTLHRELDPALAEKIAKAVKSWAIKKGATHYTHWFFPLTGKSAEKQVSFADKQRGKYIEKFDGSCLTKGETDASSFPSEGERMTFEARGYTVWDISSPMFVKSDENGNKVLYIPTAFISYNGISLDEKTPLLRAIEKLNIVATKILNMLGHKKVKNVNVQLGIEQEYFLVDENMFAKRKDLALTGRTLVGSAPSISQETFHHYFGKIDNKISMFMHDLDRELLKCGVYAKIQHNEVAPNQFEVVLIYDSATVATDQNRLCMDIMEQIAERHKMRVIFHEKPFAKVNGSGKHNNWSLSTNLGQNILDFNQIDNDTFFLFFTAILSAIDKHYDLLRTSTAGAGNDQRLGGDEAPPSVISVYIGDYMQKMIENYLNQKNLCSHEKTLLNLKTSTIAPLYKDSCDRNRTSPFAFTGNKFEFRMLGASQSPALANVVLATILADELEKAIQQLNSGKSVKEIVAKNYAEHKRIIFNGNSYDKMWQVEAQRRGLGDIKDSLSAFNVLLKKENIALFEKTGVLSEKEINVRYFAYIKTYFESIYTECKVLANILAKQIIPAVTNYFDFLMTVCQNAKSLNLDCGEIEKKAKIINEKITQLLKCKQNLTMALEYATTIPNMKEKAIFARDTILPLIQDTRNIFDAIENNLPNQFKPFPTYDDLLLN